MSENSSQRPQSLARVARSVLASMFGVQSNRNREEDFAQGKFSHYVIVGGIATLLFIVVLWAIVKLVVGLATN